MKPNKPLSIESLAKLTGQGVDDVLLKLWENEIDFVHDGNSIVSGRNLVTAKRILGIPVTSQLTSLSYWQSVFSMNESELRDFLKNSKIPISEKARKIPKGAVRILKSEIKKRNKPLVSTLKQPVFNDESPLNETVFWRTIGKKSEEVSFLLFEEVLKIHEALVADFLSHYDPIDPPGVRDNTLLESAIFRQETSIGNEQKYQSIEMKGAALLHSLIHNHPFHNGNKRTALVSLIVFLDKNEKMLVCREEDLFRFILTVAQHRIVKGNYSDLADREVIAIAEWIRDNSRVVEFGEKLVSLRKLKPILSRYNCEIIHSDGGNNLKATRTKKSKSFFGRPTILTCNFSIRNEGEELEARTLKKIREELELDEEYGIDSAAFYRDSPTAVDDFILKYRKSLLRLSRL